MDWSILENLRHPYEDGLVNRKGVGGGRLWMGVRMSCLWIHGGNAGVKEYREHGVGYSCGRVDVVSK